MTNTTILSEDTATIVSDGAGHPFNWGAVIAGSVAAVAVTFFLATLGTGIGLSYSASHATGKGFFTLASIYFFASQAFGFTVGGYLVGRLIGPEIETTAEEEFRAAAHGMVMWALVVVAGLAVTGFTAIFAPAADDIAPLSDSATAAFNLWTAFALFFGAALAIAAAISARWMDDKVSFSLAPRRR